MNTIKWNDFIVDNFTLNSNEEQTIIECPKCNCTLVKLTNQVYTSYPPKYKYICKECGWIGYA